MIPVFSLYSGVGGLDLGAKIAGLKLVAALDADEHALAIHNRIFHARSFQVRTEDVDVRKIIRTSDIPRDGSALLIGGPPCTAFSHAGFWLETKRNGDDGQVDRIKDYLCFVRELRPRAFIMENVPGLLFKNHSRVLKRFEAACCRMGYSITHAILNAADFGVPQRRRRLFVVGTRGKRNFSFTPGPFAERSRSSGWAIDELSDSQNPPEADEALRGKYASLLPNVPPGKNYLVFTERACTTPLFRWRQKYWSFLLKLHPQEPSPTIPATRITNNGPFHWLNRHLRLAEVKRLQSFPDKFPVDDGNRGRNQLGNAVPPLLAAQVIWQVRHFLSGTRRIPDRLSCALDPSASAESVSDALKFDDFGA